MKLTTRLLLILTLFFPSLVCAQGKIDVADSKLSTLVIDAGHGGKDPGCSWGDHLEKELNLKVALAFGALVERAYPDVKVVYTRKDDRFIELHQRGEIANRANADLFVSIHTDATGNSEAHGSSTYIMGNDKSEKHLAVAQRENSVIVMEGDYEAKYEGYDPNSAESFIIFSLMQYAHSEQSMIFAELVQKHYAKNTPIVDRGARQGPYLVLWRTAMPAVLTEMGFMTNKSDRDYLHSEEGVVQVAKSLFDAFSEYRARYNARVEEAATSASATAKPAPAAKPAPVAKPAPETKPAPAAKPEAKPAPKPEAKPAPKEEAKPTPAPKESKPASSPKADAKSSPKAEVKPTVEYFVQICTLASKSNPADRKFGPYAGPIVQRTTPAGKWRCLVPAASLEEAKRLCAEAQKPFPGAFVIAVADGEVSRVN